MRRLAAAATFLPKGVGRIRRPRSAGSIRGRPRYADERVPLLSAVMPDGDGVLRARWQAAQSLNDSVQGLRHSNE